jgi:hypothetical protein
MNLGKEMVDESRINVVFKRAEEMEAYGFLKPYDPSKHKSTGGRYIWIKTAKKTTRKV